MPEAAVFFASTRPATEPEVVISGPPLLPGVIDASVSMRSRRGGPSIGMVLSRPPAFAGGGVVRGSPGGPLGGRGRGGGGGGSGGGAGVFGGGPGAPPGRGPLKTHQPG